VLAALDRHGDAWLATAGAAGEPHLIPVSCWWDGSGIVVATAGRSRTARNLVAGGTARLALGAPDDVVMVDGRLAEHVPVGRAAPEVASGFARGVGWDPREIDAAWEFFVLRPWRVQAYRGYDELEGRDVMREGRWLA